MQKKLTCENCREKLVNIRTETSCETPTSTSRELPVLLMRILPEASHRPKHRSCTNMNDDNIFFEFSKVHIVFCL